MAPPAGSLPIQEGALKLPEGTTALPEGTIREIDAQGNVVHLDRQGNILGEDGTLKQHHTDARRENPPADSPAPAHTGSSLPRTPAHESALVGAGARGGSDTVRLGSDMSETGRAGDNPGRTGNDAPSPDRSPGGTANTLPTNSVDSGTPSSAGNGQARDTTPNGGGNTSNSTENSSGGGGGRDLTDGPTTDKSHRPLEPGTGGAGGTGDSAVGRLDNEPQDQGNGLPENGNSAHVNSLEHPPQEAASAIRPDGARYIDEPSEYSARIFDEIRATPDSADLPVMAERTGIRIDVLQRAKNHMFRTEHVVVAEKGVSRKGLFTPRDDIAALWQAAMRGDLHGGDFVKFQRLIAHESS
ncbi:hypothetical protein [Streptomyces sp. DH8]|uniref:hypothetical protein n=1 Tax=Streptomyces sp. DH8 TaxID=2857008 RepID=UPI001E3297D0|nr:hypothetical protein [Streptomyces sp. DH8]